MVWEGGKEASESPGTLMGHPVEVLLAPEGGPGPQGRAEMSGRDPGRVRGPAAPGPHQHVGLLWTSQTEESGMLLAKEERTRSPTPAPPQSPPGLAQTASGDAPWTEWPPGALVAEGRAQVCG